MRFAEARKFIQPLPEEELIKKSRKKEEEPPQPRITSRQDLVTEMKKMKKAHGYIPEEFRSREDVEEEKKEKGPRKYVPPEEIPAETLLEKEEGAEEEEEFQTESFTDSDFDALRIRQIQEEKGYNKDYDVKKRSWGPEHLAKEPPTAEELRMAAKKETRRKEGLEKEPRISGQRSPKTPKQKTRFRDNLRRWFTGK